MYKLLTIFCLFISSVSYSQSVEKSAKVQSQDNYETVSQTFPDKTYSNGDIYNYITFSSYILRENLVGDTYRYKYKVTIVNKSKYAGHLAKIYMSGIVVSTGEKCISCDLYPNGVWALIEPNIEGTIFWYKTNDSAVMFSYSWTNVKIF